MKKETLCTFCENEIEACTCDVGSPALRQLDKMDNKELSRCYVKSFVLNGLSEVRPFIVYKLRERGIEPANIRLRN